MNATKLWERIKPIHWYFSFIWTPRLYLLVKRLETSTSMKVDYSSCRCHEAKIQLSVLIKNATDNVWPQSRAGLICKIESLVIWRKFELQILNISREMKPDEGRVHTLENLGMATPKRIYESACEMQFEVRRRVIIIRRGYVVSV